MLLSLLLWPADAAAAPPPHTRHHHAAAVQDPMGSRSEEAAAVLSMPAAEAPCHHRTEQGLSPCCVGFACVAMHVGIAAEAVPMTMPSGASDRPSGVALLEGEGVPPDLPPPRLE